MNKTVSKIINGSKAIYAKMLIENAKLDLEPYTLESGEVKKDYYFDEKKGVLVYLSKSRKEARCVLANSSIVSQKGDYRVGINEYSHTSGVTLCFNFFDIPAYIQINVNHDKITFDCVRDEEMCHPGIYCNQDGEIVFESLDGRTNRFSDVTVDMIVCMVESIYRNIVMSLEDSKEIRNARDKFKLVEPILKDSISRTFIKSWRERIIDYESEPTASITERCLGNIVENEGCKFVNCNIENKLIRYQNDEIAVKAYDINGDYSSISIGYKDKNEDGKNSVVNIFTGGIYGAQPCARIHIELEDGKNADIEFMDTGFNSDGLIRFTDLDKNITECYMIYTGEMVWSGKQEDNCNKFDLVVNGINGFVNQICELLSNGKNNPKFERLLEIIKPALAQCVLEMNINRVKKLYSRIEENKKSIERMKSRLDNICGYEKDEFLSHMENLIAANEIYEGIVSDTQDSILEEFYTSNTKTQ